MLLRYFCEHCLIPWPGLSLSACPRWPKEHVLAVTQIFQQVALLLQPGPLKRGVLAKLKGFKLVACCQLFFERPGRILSRYCGG